MYCISTQVTMAEKQKFISYCQSPVSSSLASLKGREQEVSLPEVSNQLLDEL